MSTVKDSFCPERKRKIEKFLTRPSPALLSLALSQLLAQDILSWRGANTPGSYSYFSFAHSPLSHFQKSYQVQYCFAGAWLFERNFASLHVVECYTFLRLHVFHVSLAPLTHNPRLLFFFPKRRKTHQSGEPRGYLDRGSPPDRSWQDLPPTLFLFFPLYFLASPRTPPLQPFLLHPQRPTLLQGRSDCLCTRCIDKKGPKLSRSLVAPRGSPLLFSCLSVYLILNYHHVDPQAY